MLGNLLVYLGIGILWLIHWLPFPFIGWLGYQLGNILYWLILDRRRVVLINLAICFPQWSHQKRKAIAQEHFRCFGRGLLEHGVFWWSSRKRIQRWIKIKGLEYWEQEKDHPVIWLAPHFVGLDAGGSRIHSEFPGISMYSKQKHAAFDRLLLHGRTRFGDSLLVSRQEGLRPLIKALKRRIPFYYLPDMDLGARDALFIPFFGKPAATVTALPRLCAISGARVVPCVTRQLPLSQGYEMRFYPAWGNYPSNDIEADTRRMNAFIEERVIEMPAQYYWLHKRFKTRPVGEVSLY